MLNGMTGTDLTPLTAALPATERARIDEMDALTRGWLLAQRSPKTREAYLRDLREWLTFCTCHGLDPVEVKLRHADAYGRWLTERADPPPLADASAARKLAAVSSWYTYLVRGEFAERNPFEYARRPHVDRDHSATVGLTETEARALVAAADASTGPAGLRTAAFIRFMLGLGPRITDALALDVSSLGQERGFRTVDVLGKGRTVRRRVIPPPAAAALDAYLDARAATAGVTRAELKGPLFASASGGRLDRRDMFRLVQRVAREAGLANAVKVTPHSLRHTFVTVARERGATLEEIQDAMAHADPRTTRRYDRARNRLDRDPSQLVAAALG
jgi:site-specific recombinase XerD